jgi:hypothetical protein
MIETGYTGTDLSGKCHECKYYVPLIKRPWNRMKMDTKFCRGHCLLIVTEHSYMYKQRTETCKKFVRREDEHQS